MHAFLQSQRFVPDSLLASQKQEKKAPKKPPVIHSYAHSRGSAESTMELVFGQGQVKGFGNSSQRRGNAKFCTEPPWVNLCLKSCRPPAQRQLALTHPLSLPSYGPESCRLQGSSLIQSDLANQKKKKDFYKNVQML